MGGDLKKIQTVGRYMVEIWKAVGMDMEKVEFLHASGMYVSNSTFYVCSRSSFLFSFNAGTLC